MSLLVPTTVAQSGGLVLAVPKKSWLRAVAEGLTIGRAPQRDSCILRGSSTGEGRHKSAIFGTAGRLIEI